MVGPTPISVEIGEGFEYKGRGSLLWALSILRHGMEPTNQVINFHVMEKYKFVIILLERVRFFV